MQRERFGSRLGFILVSAGCAIGIGNIWKFPYLAVEYGGSAFLLVYIAFLLLLGIPIIVCELSVGRASRKSIALSHNELEPSGTNWHRIRWVAMVGNYIIIMFYTTICGWMLHYFFKMLKGDFLGSGANTVVEQFDKTLATPTSLFFWTVLVILIASGICSIGLRNGIERIMKIVIIIFFALMIILAFNSLTLPNASEGIKQFLVPDFRKLISNGIGNAVFAAMSQAFFTLSLGIGNMAIFGSYLSKSYSITGDAINVVILDTIVSLLAAIIIIPACVSFGMDVASGPRLTFITLPKIFANMNGGRIWGTLFFFSAFVATFSTIIAIYENIISISIDIFSCTRKKAAAVNIALTTLLSLPCILGFNVLSGIQPLGVGTTIMDLEDFIVTSNILPIGSVIFLLFCTNKNGWGWDNFIKEVNLGKGAKFPEKLRSVMTNVLPWIIIIIYLKGYYDTFSEHGLVIFVFWMINALIFVQIVSTE